MASTITGCISFFAFDSLLGIPTGITSSAIGLKIYEIIGVIKKYKSIIKKKRRSTKSKLDSIEVLNSKALIDSNISRDKFVLINNVLKEYYDVREEIKNLKI